MKTAIHRIGFLLLASVSIFSPHVRADELHVPALTSPVEDQAKIFSAEEAARLDQRIRAIDAQGMAQIQVWTIPSLLGHTIEEAGIQAGDQWKLGDKKISNGVILLIAPQEHKVRIEVGYGLESVLTDARTNDAIHEVFIPAVKQSGFGMAALSTVDRLDSILKLGDEARSTKPAIVNVNIAQLLFWGFFILIFVLRIAGSGHSGILGFLAGYGLGGGFSGRGRNGGFGGGGFGSGGFGGGGGWSGGGGGFGGGGSSGSW